MRRRTPIPHLNTVKMGSSVPAKITSKEKKRTENKGDDVSLLQSKGHQHMVDVVQERSIEVVVLLRPEHRVCHRQYGEVATSLWTTWHGHECFDD